MNTRVPYMYRDASNYKMVGDVVLEGEITPDERRLIAGHLDEGTCFIAEQVGFPNLRALWATHFEDDHVWHELYVDDIGVVADEPTVAIDIHAWVGSFCSTTWDEHAAQAVLDQWVASTPEGR